MTIPLEDAFLCLDCQHVGDSAVSCEHCASEALLSLAAVLNREPKEEVAA